jgi:hypothetical protein
MDDYIKKPLLEIWLENKKGKKIIALRFGIPFKKKNSKVKNNG